MFFVLIPLSLLAVGLVAAGRIIYRKIPRDLENWNAQLAQEDFGPTFYQKSWAVLAQESKKFFINTSTKAVHRLKIATLKTDNFFGKLLQEMRQRRQRIHEDAVESDRNESVVADGPISEPRTTPLQVWPRGASLRVNTTTHSSPPLQVGLPALVRGESAPKAEPTQPRLSQVIENGFIGGAKPAVEAASKAISAFAAKERQCISQLAYNPKDVAVYKKLGWLYLEHAQPFQARQAFKMAVKLGSKDKNIITKLLEMGGVVHKEGQAADVELSAQKTDNKPNVSGQVKARVKRLKITKI